MSSNIVTDDAHNWGAAAKVAASMKIKYPVAAVASGSYACWVRRVVEIAQSSSAFNSMESIASVSASPSAAASDARRMVFV